MYKKTINCNNSTKNKSYLYWSIRNITHQRFADDTVLASHDPKELHTMLKELNREGKTVEIEINLKKTQVMFNEQINGEMEVKIDQTRLHISRATNHHPAK